MADLGWVWVADTPQGGLYKYVKEGGQVTEWVVGNTSLGPSAGSYAKYAFPGLGDDEPGGGGLSYGPRLTDEDGSVTGIPGATYQMGSNGLPASVVRPPSGGGSTTINYNTQAANDLGANRYVQTYDEYGNYGERDLLDNSFRIISKAANSADPDGDGYNNSTGLPVGVISSSHSPSGFFYQGKPVNADGSLYTGSGGTGKTTTWTGYGSKGQGTYILDEDFNEVKYLGPTTAAGAGASGATSGAVGGGGGSGFNIAGAAQQLQATEMSNAEKLAYLRAQNEENLKYKAQALQLENQYRQPDTLSANTAAQLAYNRERDAKRDALDAENLRMQQTDRFLESVTAADPARARAVLFANGLSAGGNWANRLSEGQNALSDVVNGISAQQLAQIRGNHQGSFAQIAGLPSGLAGGGAPISPGVPPSDSSGAPASGGVPGGAGPTAPTRPTLQGNWKLDSTMDGQPTGWVMLGTMGQVRRPFTVGETTGPTDWAKLAMVADIDPEARGTAGSSDLGNRGWYQVGADQWIDPLNPDVPVSTAQKNNLVMERNMQLAGLSGFSWDAGDAPNALQIQSPTGPGTSNMFRLDPKNDPRSPGYVNPQQKAENAAAQAAAAAAAKGVNPANGGNIPLPQTAPPPDPTVMGGGFPVQGLNRGGSAPMAVVGEGGGSKPLGSSELARAVMGPDGRPTLDVRPLTSRQAQGLMRGGVPGYNLGTMNNYENQATYGTTYSQPSLTTTYQQPEPAYQPAYTQSYPVTGLTPAPEVRPVPQLADPRATVAPPPAPMPQPVAPTPAPQAVAPAPVPQAVTPAPQAPAPAPPPAAPAPSTPTPAVTPNQVASTPSGLFNAPPATAEQIQEIANWRESQLDPMFAEIGPYSLALENQSPDFYRGFLENYQTARGIPAESFDNEIRKWRVRGLSRDQMLAGTGR